MLVTAAEPAQSHGRTPAGLLLTVGAVVMLILALQRVQQAVRPFAELFRAMAAAMMTVLLVGGALVLVVVGVALR